MTGLKKTEAIKLTSYVLTAAALFLLLHLGLLSALFSGLLVYCLIRFLSPFLAKKIDGTRARLIIVGLIAVVVMGALSLAAWGAVFALSRSCFDRCSAVCAA